MDAIRIRETKKHRFTGIFPDVPTYEHVDTALLYEGDESPFHIVLPIATLGETSKNGLCYDVGLVDAIETQLPGLGGIRGHLEDDELPYEFPADEVHWIGAIRQGETLWAKGYIPPGETREDTRRRKARGGGIGTSIFGAGMAEENLDGTYRLKAFQLESLDLGSSQRVARHVSGQFAITAEFDKGENLMPVVAETTITAADVPASVREQIVKEAQISHRVTELEAQNTELSNQVKELREYGSIVASIRAMIPTSADITATVSEMYTTLESLRTMLGDVQIVVTVEEMNRSIGELKKTTFTNAVNAAIAEYTNWNGANTPEITQLRNLFTMRVTAESKGDANAVTETAKQIWANELQAIAESIKSKVAGGSAIVSGTPSLSAKPSDKLTDNEIRALVARTTGKVN